MFNIGQTIYIQGFGNENMRAIILDVLLDSYKVKSKYGGVFHLNKILCKGEPTQHCSNPRCIGLLQHKLKN